MNIFLTFLFFTWNKYFQKNIKVKLVHTVFKEFFRIRKHYQKRNGRSKHGSWISRCNVPKSGGNTWPKTTKSQCNFYQQSGKYGGRMLRRNSYGVKTQILFFIFFVIISLSIKPQWRVCWKNNWKLKRKLEGQHENEN